MYVSKRIKVLKKCSIIAYALHLTTKLFFQVHKCQYEMKMFFKLFPSKMWHKRIQCQHMVLYGFFLLLFNAVWKFKFAHDNELVFLFLVHCLRIWVYKKILIKQKFNKFPFFQVTEEKNLIIKFQMSNYLKSHVELWTSQFFFLFIDIIY